MRTLFTISIISAISTAIIASTALAALPFSAQFSLAPVLKEVMPSVVNIKTTAQKQVRNRSNPWFSDPFFRNFLPPIQREVSSIGSGVIVDAKDGIIVTNNHVVAGADKIQVTLMDGRIFDAEMVGQDDATDLALIRITAKRLVSIPFANSEALQVGDFVVAIGNPFGLDHTVTSGIISALGRLGSEAGVSGPYKTFIQTDASINPGNSGGALITLDGKLAGINSAIISKSGGNVGIGFAVPSNMVSRVKSQLISYGSVRRGVLGINAQTLTSALAEGFGLNKNLKGALITEVQAGSAAERGGVRIGDVVIKLGASTVIKTAPQLINEFGSLPIDTSTSLTVVRDGKKRKINVAVSDRQLSRSLDGSTLHPKLKGAAFGLVNKLEITKEQSTTSTTVITITGVAKNTPAYQVGLRGGDEIYKANRKPIESLSNLKEVFSKNGNILLLLKRGNSYLTLRIRK